MTEGKEQGYDRIFLLQIGDFYSREPFTCSSTGTARGRRGHIGSYDSCLSYSPVTSCWRPLTGSEPYLGQVGALSTEPELKVEVTCRREKLDETLRAVKAVHLYEEPVINVIRLYQVGI